MDVAENLGDATWALQRLLTREGGSGIRILDLRRQKRALTVLNDMRHQTDRLRHDSMYKELHRASRAGHSLGDMRLDRPIHNVLGPRPTLRVNRHGAWNLNDLPEQVTQYPPPPRPNTYLLPPRGSLLGRHNANGDGHQTPPWPS